MLRHKPFVYAYVASTSFLGVMVGARIDPTMVAYAGVFFAAAAAIGSLIAAWRPGLDAPGGRLWLMTVAGNPAVFAAVVMMLFTRGCDGGSSSASCVYQLVAWIYLPIAVVAPLIGLAARRWWPRS